MLSRPGAAPARRAPGLVLPTVRGADASRAAYALAVRAPPPVLWAPDDGPRIERATLTRYARLLAERGVETVGYHDLWCWSVDQLEDFWGSIWSTFGVRASTPYTRVLGSRTMPGAEWFPGARLNFAEHVFPRSRPFDGSPSRHAAELRPLAETTWGHARGGHAEARGGACCGTGVGPGDRVVAYLPNVPEAVIAMLAVSSIGAVWATCAPDFGAKSVIDRFAQLEPKVLHRRHQLPVRRARTRPLAGREGAARGVAETRTDDPGRWHVAAGRHCVSKH